MRALTLTMIALLLCGCATPQVALDEANHGVKLMAELEISLAEFRRLETHSLTTKADSIRAQKDAMSLVEKTLKRDMRARAAVGDSVSGRTRALLLEHADALAEDDAAYQAGMKRNEAEVAKLLTPIPSTRDATTAAQAALAELGKELDGEIRRDELFKFWKQVKTSVDDARKKIADAEADAAKSQCQKECM